MSTIQHNIQAANESRVAVASHCMCAKLEETKTHLIVFFPPGYTLGGVRVSMANGVKWAFDKALEKMEHQWKSTLPNYQS